MPERDHGMNGDIENEHRSGSREQQIVGDEFQAVEESVEAIDIFDNPPPNNPGILNDEWLLHSANTTQRTRLMSGLQRTHGNAQVQRVIENIHAQRTPKPNPFAEEGGGTGTGGIFSARSTWDTEVVGGIRLAHETLGAESLNAELAFDILTAVRESLTSLADEYRDSDAKMTGDLRHFRMQLMSACNALRPHVNATAPIENIREAINPEGPLESWINTLEGVIQ